MYPSERASAAFKKGYRDCRDGNTPQQNTAGTFKNNDYREGWKACANELYWEALRKKGYTRQKMQDVIK